MRLESEANPKVKRWKKIALDARAARREGLTLLEGVHVVESALDAKAELTCFIVREAGLAREAAALVDERRGDLPVFELPARIYDEIAPVENGVGLMAEMKMPPAEGFDEDWARSDVLFLDGVQDAGNVGTLIRTAVASGFKRIALTPQCAKVWSAKVLRAGMGAHFGARFVENVDPEEFARMYEGEVWAADARGGEDLFNARLDASGPVCWVMGSEGQGVSEKMLQLSSRRLYIPIEADCESLNVGCAASVCMFDTRRRRRAG